MASPLEFKGWVRLPDDPERPPVRRRVPRGLWWWGVYCAGALLLAAAIRTDVLQVKPWLEQAWAGLSAPPAVAATEEPAWLPDMTWAHRRPPPAQPQEPRWALTEVMPADEASELLLAAAQPSASESTSLDEAVLGPPLPEGYDSSAPLGTPAATATAAGPTAPVAVAALAPAPPRGPARPRLQPPGRRRTIASIGDPLARARAHEPHAGAPRRAPKLAPRGGGGSCEAALAAYRQKVSIGQSSGPADISREQYGAVLNRGSYFAHCGAPSSMGIRICAAVQHGRAVGVTVTTTPANSRVRGCVAAAVRGLSFPSHHRLDVTTTTFAPL